MRLFLYSQLLLLLCGIVPVICAADPQANLLNLGCSKYNASDPKSFLSNLDAALSDLAAQLNASRFATAQRPRSADPAYALALCRDYLSEADCASCFAAARAALRSNCSAANGARAIYDGCEIRYESAPFSDQATLPGNAGICGNRSDPAAGFASDAGALMSDLAAAAPRTKGFFAAAKRGSAYGIAQCAPSVTADACAQCLGVAYGNIKNCPPVSDGRAYDAGCFMRYADAAFFAANWTMDLAPYLASGGSSNTGAIAGGIAGGVAGLLLIGLLLFLIIRRTNKSHISRRGDILGATELQGPLNFYYSDLSAATKNFKEENKLGEGGFGDVYKGVLKNGKTVAVKKLAIGQTSRAKADFQSEVKLISNVHHRNLVRLLGCSNKGPDLLLVYEYMANGSLDKFLFGEKCGSLNWKQRFDIIVGMARGLAYLHHEFHVCIIHRDIKSSNILLDDDYQPKIADFGLARLLPEGQSHLSTKFAGTLGYTAPEYAIHGQLSEKVDTYSYGVVVLEIISGRKSNDIKLEPSTQYLLEWAWKLYEIDELMKLVDESLDPNEYKTTEIKRVIEIALLCTQSAVSARPTMSEVVVSLLSKDVSVVQPTRPVFIDATTRIPGDTSTSTGSSTTSNATASMSHFSAR